MKIEQCIPQPRYSHRDGKLQQIFVAVWLSTTSVRARCVGERRARRGQVSTRGDKQRRAREIRAAGRVRSVTPAPTKAGRS